MPSIPPTNDPQTGALVCPIGYTLNPSTVMCDPNSAAPFDMQDPTIRKVVTGLADVQVDPSAYGKALSQGFRDSGIIERFIVGVMELPYLLTRTVVELAMSLFDDFLALLGEVFLGAQGQHTSGYYRLAAGMMQDMLNIFVDGEKMFTDMQNGGRVQAMQDLGGAVFTTLASEFVGARQLEAGGLFSVAQGQGVGGLQKATLTPESGINGAKAFLGFMTSFAVREGNTDILAEYIPHGLGRIFKDFAEDFAKNLGIGRMGRLVWKPLVTTTVSTPMQWALNKEYRPTQLSAIQARRALLQNLFTVAEYEEEVARHGYSDERRSALEWESLKGPTRQVLRALHATGKMPDADYLVWNRRINHTDEVTQLLDQADDMALPRAAVHGAAQRLAEDFLRGKITGDVFRASIDAMKHGPLGTVWLSDAEVDALKDLPVIVGAAASRHLSVSQNMRLYLDGIVSLQEFEAALLALGYDQATVTEETQEVLLMQKRQSDKAARAAASAIRGPLWHLSVAQLETGLAQGLVKDADLRAELAARHYTPAAINALVAEMYAKAKITPPTAPTT